MRSPPRSRFAPFAACLLAALTVLYGTAGDPLGAATVITEQARLLAPDGKSGDRFGASVDISGDTAIVGMRPYGGGPNAVYVFVRDGSGWSLQATLRPSEDSTWFGAAVAISGDTAVVAAPYGHPRLYSGAVYVYARSGSTWVEHSRLLAPDARDFDGYASSVAIAGDAIVVGSTYGSAPDESGTGAAYVFVRDGTGWSLQAKLLASNGSFNDSFGRSVAISEDTLVVGAPYHDSTGAAYVFKRSGSRWDEQARLLAFERKPSDLFGESVAISGGTVVVGAPQAYNYTATDLGAAYVFADNGPGWSQQERLLASDGELHDAFGWRVGISGNRVVVGARNHNGRTGAAYLFVRSGSRWSEHAELLPSDGESLDDFGSAVAVSGGTVMVGALQADAGLSEETGAVYLFPAAGVTVTPTEGLLTLERGGTADFLVVLNTQPAGDVVIDLVSSDLDEASVSPARLTFTADDWPTPQAVTLTGQEDFVADNGAPYTVALLMNQELTADVVYDEIDPADVSAVNLEFAGDFHLVESCRVLDTRLPGQEPLASLTERVVVFHDVCGVPPTARAVAISLIVVLPTGRGSIALYPGDFPHPGLETLTFEAGRNRCNNTIVPLATDGTGALAAAPLITGNGSAHLVLDVSGYFE